jgi:hypothetical protein
MVQSPPFPAADNPNILETTEQIQRMLFEQRVRLLQ